MRTLLLLLLSIPDGVHAQDYYYVVVQNTIKITSYLCASNIVAIPGTIDGLPVTSIEGFAFSGCTSLESVIIPSSVTSIEGGAFSGCTSLTNVTIASGTTSIGDHAFYGCASLASITIPSSVTSIGDLAFFGCTRLESVAIPRNLIRIGNMAFFRCNSLTAITVDANNPTYGSVDGVLFDKSRTRLLQCPGRKTGNYTIPGSTASIGDWAFYGCTGLVSVAIPGSMTSIGSGAFDGCTSLESVAIPSKVTSIGYGALNGCTNLAAIIVDVDNPAYRSVDGVLFDKSRTRLIQCAGRKTGNYMIPNSVTSIEHAAFFGCAGLESVAIPGSVTSIGYAAFNGCSGLKSVTIPSNVSIIGVEAFFRCPSLEAITVDTDNPNYGSADGVLFDKIWTTLIQCPGGKTRNYTIPSNITSVGEGAFNGCTGLESVTIPGSVTSIRDKAFYGCTSLVSVTIPSSVTSIGDQVFFGCTSLVNVAIPSSVTSIGDEAFSSCTSLVSVQIPSSVRGIGFRAFLGCTSLAAISVDADNTSYGSVDGVLFDESRTTLIQCPGGKTGNYTIPGRVTRIWPWAFFGCTGLAEITVDVNNPTFHSVDGVLFDKNGTTLIQCPGGKTGNYTIPSCVTNIGYGAFYGCTSLREVNFLGDVPRVWNNAFFGLGSEILHYLPGTAGWPTSLAGVPTAPWVLPNPVILLSKGSGFGVRADQFDFTISWATNAAVVVEASTSLHNPIWSPISTNILTDGTSKFHDPERAKYPARFYRLRYP